MKICLIVDATECFLDAFMYYIILFSVIWSFIHLHVCTVIGYQYMIKCARVQWAFL